MAELDPADLELRAGPYPGAVAEEFRIVRGVPTDEELAAIIGVLLLRASAPPAPGPEPSNAWVSSARPAQTYPDGRPTRPGPSAWRSSALPR